jgi:hypothetical protein
MPNKQIVEKTLLASAVVFALLSFSCGVSQVELLHESNALGQRLSSKLQPAVRSWIDEQGVALARFGAEEDGIREAMGQRFAGQNLDDDGRDILGFLILTHAVEVSDRQIRRFEDQRSAIRAAVEKMREFLPRLQADLRRHSNLHDLAPVPLEIVGWRQELGIISDLMRKTPSWTIFVERDAVDMADLRAVEDDLKGKLDSMNELSEMTSLRLQMMMDRRSKFITTLSNIMKKVSTTQESITQNLK